MKVAAVLVLLAILILPLRWGLLRDSSGGFHLIDKGFMGKGPLYRDLSKVVSPELIAAIVAKGHPFQVHWDVWASRACEKRVAAFESRVREIVGSMQLPLSVKAGPLSDCLPQVTGKVTEIDGGVDCPSGGTYHYTGGEDGHVVCNLHRGRDFRMKEDSFK